MSKTDINPFYASYHEAYHARDSDAEKLPIYAKLPCAPQNGSPVPHLTSLYHFDRAGEYGSREYPGNCGGNLIKDLLKFFGAKNVFDPMTAVVSVSSYRELYVSVSAIP